MLKNNLLFNESVLKAQLLRYSAQPNFSAQGLVLEKVFIFHVFLIPVSFLSTYLKNHISGPLEKERTTKVDSK